ncbi:hypothetical protein CK203_061138 [Vitis vinifera]|uniref:Uncharacterized protein n=1 Tax=Vitis vinifera TaxID=29760 RepID=A0A438GI51_VITVI|nr:hypothetical protein CK203_061138 [Vitis vinifera]
MEFLNSRMINTYSSIKKEVEEARLKDMKIKNYMFQSIDKTIMETILDKNTTKNEEGERLMSTLPRALTIANKMKTHEERMGAERDFGENLEIDDSQRMNCHSGNARDEQALKVSYGERALQYECPSWEKSANYAEFDEEEEMLLMSYVESTTRNEKMCGSSTRVATITCAGTGSGSLTLMRLSDTQ